jgi:hypothetical protein
MRAWREFGRWDAVPRLTHYVLTYYLSMNVTLSIGEDLLHRAREAARRRGISLNQMIRDFLTDVTSDSDSAETVRELEELRNGSHARSRGRTWKREDLYDRPVLR